MKILKKGKAFVAYCTEENEFPTTGYTVGSEVGRISITTGRYCGGQGLVELSKHLREYLKPQEEKYQELIDEVIEQVVADANSGDTTVLDEILKNVPKEVLIQSLPEEAWAKYK